MLSVTQRGRFAMVSLQLATEMGKQVGQNVGNANVSKYSFIQHVLP